MAKRAGVSVPTVSRVLNGSVPVSHERRSRVLAAIEELGYHPNGAARALAMGNQQLVTVLTSNTTRYGYAATIQGIEEAAREAGYMVTIAVVESDERGRVAQAINQVLGQPMTGTIVLEYDPAGLAAVRAVPNWLPVVVASSGSPTSGTAAYAAMDDRIAAAHATAYLLDLGHRTVHHIAIPSADGESARTLGWREALRESGAEVPDVVHSDWEPLVGYRMGRRLLDAGDVTAVLCGNDELAMAVMRAATDLGMRVPDDVSVVGFDDSPLSVLWSPALTTVRQDFRRLGRDAFELLQTQVNRPAEVAPVRIVPELIVRASAGRAPTRR